MQQVITDINWYTGDVHIIIDTSATSAKPHLPDFRVLRKATEEAEQAASEAKSKVIATQKAANEVLKCATSAIDVAKDDKTDGVGTWILENIGLEQNVNLCDWAWWLLWIEVGKE